MEVQELVQAVQISHEINLLLDDVHKNTPYNINVIDELHANENAHSRILCKLLQYQDAGKKYRILDSLISYISKSFPETDFGNIQIYEPQITQETERIDLWVRDRKGKYAIILENKVRGAVDQDAQLCRYIEKTIKSNFKQEQIFIVYLPGDDHEPSENSWGTYKEDFEARYAKLSFRDNIINWLKEDVLPNCIIKEDILISAIKQYIDHLEGLYRKRPSQDKTSVLNSTTIQKIGISDEDLSYQIPKISEYISLLQKAEYTVKTYRDNSMNELMNQKMVPFLNEIGKKYNLHWIYPNTKILKYDWLNTQWMGFFFYKEGWNTFQIGFEFQNYYMRDFGSGIRYQKNVKTKSQSNNDYPSYGKLSSLTPSISNTCRSTENWPIFWPNRASNWFDLEITRALITDDMYFADFIEKDIQLYLDLIEQNNIGM